MSRCPKMNTFRKKAARTVCKVSGENKCVSGAVTDCVRMLSPTGKPGTLAPAMGSGSISLVLEVA